MLGVRDVERRPERRQRGTQQVRERARRNHEAAPPCSSFLRVAVVAVRERFGGRITHPLAEVADQFRDGVRNLVAGRKPVAITGFGTATWRGAGETAPRSMEILEYDDSGLPVRLDGEYVRDEVGQATYLRELLEVFDAEGVDSAFVFLFALENLPHRPDGDPRDDLDLASLGIVKVLDGRTGTTYPGMVWEPKAAFTALAERYAGSSPDSGARLAR